MKITTYVGGGGEGNEILLRNGRRVVESHVAERYRREGGPVKRQNWDHTSKIRGVILKFAQRQSPFGPTVE